MQAGKLNIIPEESSVHARAGYDHSWFPWSATQAREPRTWPHGCSVALSIVLDLGAFEFPNDDIVPPPGGRGVSPAPDIPRASHREFGHRVGVYRCMDMLQAAGLPFTVALDALTVSHYPALTEHVVAASSGVISAGLSANRPITSQMTEHEERHYIQSALDALPEAAASEPLGWLSPQHSESSVTPRILAEEGVDYVLDWGNDDSPYPFGNSAEGLWALPAVWELADVNAMFHRGLSPWCYADMFTDYVVALVEERPAHPAAVTLLLSPWLSGQAFRAAAIEVALARLSADERIWTSTAPEIIKEAQSG